MANTDNSYVILRYDTVSGTLQYFAGQDWYDCTLANPGEVPSSRNIGTTAPITGGGDLSADRTLALTLANGKAWIGNVSNVPVAVTLTGDVTTTNAGVTSIGSGKVVPAKISATVTDNFTFPNDVTVSENLAVGSTHSTSTITFSGNNAAILGYSGSRLDIQINGSSQFIDTGDQISINGGTKLLVGGSSAAAVSAAAEVRSTTQGFLPPCMTTTQRDAIATPDEGLMIYNLTTHVPNVYNGSAWKAVTVS